MARGPRIVYLNNKAHFLKVARRKRGERERERERWKNVTAILLKGHLIKVEEY